MSTRTTILDSPKPLTKAKSRAIPIGLIYAAPPLLLSLTFAFVAAYNLSFIPDYSTRVRCLVATLAFGWCAVLAQSAVREMCGNGNSAKPK